MSLSQRGVSVLNMHLKMTLAVLFLTGTMGGLASALGKLQAFTTWTLLIGGIFFIYLLVPFLRDYTGRAGAGASARLKWWAAYALVLLCITLGVTFTVFGMALTIGATAFMRVFELAMQGGAASRSVMVVGTALATAAVGTAFFIFRLRQRLVYGATEAVAGISIAAHRMSIEPTPGIPTDTGFYFAVLTAGIYLVVRGLDNMHQAVKAGDPLLQRLQKLGAWMQIAPRQRTQRG
jgi:hypothetical protein